MTDAALSITGWYTYDEYGQSTDPDQPYGYLGQHERENTTESAGLTLMGVRLYSAGRALFTSTDPVFGGNEGSYVYPGDPVNKLDLTGEMWGWAWSSLMFGFEQAVEKACTAILSPAAWIACSAVAGYIGGGIKYIGEMKWVKHRSWSWSGARKAARAGLLQSVSIAGLLNNKWGKMLSKHFWKYMGRIRDWAVSKLRRMGYRSLAAAIFTLSVALNVIFTPPRRD